jgi:hypothetical protein
MPSSDCIFTITGTSLTAVQFQHYPLHCLVLVLILTAVNSCSSSSNISDIAIQRFSGIVEESLVLITPNKTVYAMNIIYTSIASQAGLEILCATALDKLVNEFKNSIDLLYYSTNISRNQYCVTFTVGSIVTPTCSRVTSAT